MLTELSDAGLIRWIPLPPLLAAAVHGLAVGLLRRSLSQNVVAWLSCGAVGVSLLLSGLALSDLIGLSGEPRLVDDVGIWIGLGVAEGAFASDFGFAFDPLSALMCLLVTSVGLLVQLYSVGYMHADPRDDHGFQRFFAYTSLFIAAMLVLVLADDLLLLFFGWQAAGLCSYLLIGFWYSDAANAQAGVRAFVVGRLGDVGFVVGSLLLFWSLAKAGAPSIGLHDLEAGIAVLRSSPVVVPSWLGGAELPLPSVIAVCFLLAAVARSAQLPLSAWMSSAMAAPLPAAALIHVSCMVTAGVYLVCRLSPLFVASPGVARWLVWTGAATALFGAAVAAVQADIKRLLAWSTVSQVGLMYVAAGAGAFGAAMYHVIAHGLAKAVLLMGAGIVLLALEKDTDLRRMGGLGSRLVWTRLCMWFGVWALAGLPPSAGFFSQQQILAAGFAVDLPGRTGLHIVLLASVPLTAFYAARMVLLALHGKTRIAAERRRRIQVPGRLLLGPTVALTAFSVLGLLLGMPQLWGDVFGVRESNSLYWFLAPVFPDVAVPALVAAVEWRLTEIAALLSLVGIGLAVLLYELRPGWSEWLAGRLARPRRALEQGLGLDALESRVVVGPVVSLARRVLADCIETRLLDGTLVNGTGRGLRRLTESLLRPLQSGLVPAQLIVTTAGGLALVAWLLFGGPA